MVNGGEFVVSCMVNVVFSHHVFCRQKNAPTFAKIFLNIFVALAVAIFLDGGVI
jgi:hypothetical protein